MKKENLILESFASKELNTKELRHVYGGTEATNTSSSGTPSNGGVIASGGGGPYLVDDTDEETRWDGDSDTRPRTGNQQIP